MLLGYYIYVIYYIYLIVTFHVNFHLTHATFNAITLFYLSFQKQSHNSVHWSQASVLYVL